MQIYVYVHIYDFLQHLLLEKLCSKIYNIRTIHFIKPLYSNCLLVAQHSPGNCYSTFCLHDSA